MPKRTAFRRRSALASAVLTALSLAVVTALSAVVGVLIAREVGRSAETDGFFAGYSVFLVLVLAATALRVVVLPPLARARLDGTFERELGSYAAALAVVALPALAIALVASEWAAGQLTGDLPAPARDAAAVTLRFVVPAAVAHLYASLAASALAAHDSYGTAAAGYAAGSVAGLAVIVLLIDEHGIAACAWGLAVNGGVALAVPATALAARTRSLRLRGGATLRRLRELARAVALPLVLQALFVVCVRFASGFDTGAITTFTYAYLVAAGLVAVTASSLGLVSSVPLARDRLTSRRAAEHIVRTSWLAFAAVAGAAGVFALVGDRVVAAVLGASYDGVAGHELGRLIAAFGPWMAASVGVTVTFPLLFVARRDRRLPPLAVGALALHIPVSWAATDAWGLVGAAVALTISTVAILVGLLALLGGAVLVDVVRGLAVAAATTGSLALLAFGSAQLAAGSITAALAGAAAFAALVFATRALGLRESWSYLRSLE